MHKAVVAVLVLGGLIALLVAFGPIEHADEESPSTQPDDAVVLEEAVPRYRDRHAGGNEVSAPSAVAWRMDLDAALESARASGRYVLLYLRWSPKTCPACRMLEDRVFSQPEAEAVAERFVPVQLPLELGIHPIVDRLIEHEEVRWAPTLLALASDGDIVRRNLVPGLPPMNLDGRPMAGSSDELPTLQRLFEKLEGVADDDLAQRARIDALQAEAEAGGIDEALALGRLLEARGRPAAAQRVYGRALQASDAPELGEAFADLCARTGNLSDARLVIERMIRIHPLHDRQLAWRLRLHTLPGQGTVDETRARLRTLIEEAAREGQVMTEGKARVALALLLAAEGHKDAARAHLAFFEREAASMPEWSAETLFDLFLLAAGTGELVRAWEYGEAILRRYPESPAALSLKHGMLAQVRTDRYARKPLD